jgi:16S rRNA (cytosine967-C5)-methyltransferase
VPSARLSKTPQNRSSAGNVSAARRKAFEILRRVEEEKSYASVLLSRLDTGLRVEDRALCHELVLGVLRWRSWLDRLIEHLAERNVDSLDLAARLALELGLYQLRFLARVPPPAAVNESVKLVRAGRSPAAAGFVNAVLRRAARERDYDPTADVGDALERVAVETSHPRWLIERWAELFGDGEAEALAHANNQPAPVAPGRFGTTRRRRGRARAFANRSLRLAGSRRNRIGSPACPKGANLSAG